jgi:gas vesicle protein
LGSSGQVGSGGLAKVATVAGSIAAGFAMGGPFGAVVGAGAALLAVGTKSEESARRQQAFLEMQSQINAQAKTLATTLHEQSGAVTRLTRETVAKNLADNGAFTAADKILHRHQGGARQRAGASHREGSDRGIHPHTDRGRWRFPRDRQGR